MGGGTAGAWAVGGGGNRFSLAPGPGPAALLPPPRHHRPLFPHCRAPCTVTRAPLAAWTPPPPPGAPPRLDTRGGGAERGLGCGGGTLRGAVGSECERGGVTPLAACRVVVIYGCRCCRTYGPPPPSRRRRHDRKDGCLGRRFWPRAPGGGATDATAGRVVCGVDRAAPERRPPPALPPHHRHAQTRGGGVRAGAATAADERRQLWGAVMR